MQLLCNKTEYPATMQRPNIQQVTRLTSSPWGAMGLAYSYAPRLSPTPKVLIFNALQTYLCSLGHRDIETTNRNCRDTKPETAKNFVKGVYFYISLGDFKPHAPRPQV